MNTPQTTTRFLPGDRLLKFTDTAKLKFGHSARWLWSKIKSPDFVQPVYLDGSPHFIEREVDEFLQRALV